MTTKQPPVDVTADWTAEWQELDGSWTHVAGPGPVRAVLRELRQWKEQNPLVETRVRKERT